MLKRRSVLSKKHTMREAKNKMVSLCDIFPDDPMCTTEVDPSMSDIATTMGYEGIGMVY